MNNWIYFYFMIGIFFGVTAWVGYVTTKIMSESTEH